MLFGAEPRASLAQRDARFLAKKRGLSLSRQAEDGQQAGVSNGTRIAHARQVVVALVDFQSSPGFRSQRREPSRARNNPPENHAGDAVGKKKESGETLAAEETKDNSKWGGGPRAAKSARQKTRRRRAQVRRETTPRGAAGARGRTRDESQHFGVRGGQVYRKNQDAGMGANT